MIRRPLVVSRQVRNRLTLAARRRQRLRQFSGLRSRVSTIRRPVSSKSRALVPIRRANPRQSQMGFLGNQRTARWAMMLKGRGFQSRTRHVRGRLTTSLQTDSALWRSIGMRLSGPLKPNRDRIDLFDKTRRTQIVHRYILGGLQNIGTNLKQAPQEIAFPSQLQPMFAISIRPTRFENLRARLGPWEKHLIHWQGTNGEILDKNKLVRDGTAVARLRRGEIGCYDSHYRLWKHMSDNNIPHAFILEDDADIHYGHDTASRLNKMFDDLQRQNIPFDIVYLGHNTRHRPKKIVGGLGVPGGTQGLFMYYLTLEGARKLIPSAIPMRQAVDDYVTAHRAMRQFSLEPRLGWVVEIERSDTANIF